MTPEAEDYLKKARDHLDEARKIAGIGLAKAAARSAYYFKEAADYGVGGGAELTMAEANDAIAMAESFIGWVAVALI